MLLANRRKTKTKKNHGVGIRLKCQIYKCNEKPYRILAEEKISHFVKLILVVVYAKGKFFFNRHKQALKILHRIGGVHISRGP